MTPLFFEPIPVKSTTVLVLVLKAVVVMLRAVVLVLAAVVIIDDAFDVAAAVAR